MKSCLTRAFAIVSLVAVSATAPLAGQQAAPATAPAQAARPSANQVTRNPSGSHGHLPAPGAQGDRGHAERQLGQRQI
jgi:hypothetical protein